MIKFDIDNLTAGAPLFRKYDGQVQPQPAYVEMTEDGNITADWSGEIGNAVPMTVWHNRTLRWRVPERAEGLMLADYLRSHEDLFERLHAGHSVEWDGSNMVGKLTEDAQDAYTELNDLLENFEPQVEVWSAHEFIFSDHDNLDIAWPRNLTLEEAVKDIEDDAADSNIVIDGDVRETLLNRVQQIVDDGEEDGLSETQFAAWCEETGERTYWAVPSEWGTPQSERGRIVQSSYGVAEDDDVILERRFDASDRTTKCYAYRTHPDDTGEDWNPNFNVPMLGEPLGRCIVKE